MLQGSSGMGTAKSCGSSRRRVSCPRGYLFSHWSVWTPAYICVHTDTLLRVSVFCLWDFNILGISDISERERQSSVTVIT